MFPDETACKVHLTNRRWPDGVTCFRCGNNKVYTLKRRPFNWLCKSASCLKASKTGYRFSLYVGSIFENTNVKLRAWFKVLYLMLSSKKGMSALQIHRMTGTGSYRTAWYVSHRLHAGLADPEFRKLMSVVEVDETFTGGKEKNRLRHQRTSAGSGGFSTNKTGVMGAISRRENVVCQIIENADAKTLTNFVRETVSTKVSLLAIDEWRGYLDLTDEGYRHRIVRHKGAQYVHGNVHMQCIESFWSLLKRGVMGTYHNVSPKYLPPYLYEFAFRHKLP